MTNYEFFKAVASNEINEEVIAKAQELVVKHEDSLAKAKAKRAEKAQTTDANIEVALKALTATPQTCSDLAAKFTADGMERANDKDGKGITPQYVAKLMKSLVDDGKAVRVEVKGGKGKVKAYTLA